MLDTAHADYLQARRRGWLTALVLVISTAWDFVTTGRKQRLRPAWRRTTTPANKKRELGTMLDQLIEYMKSRSGVWFAAREQIANHVKTADTTAP